MKTFCDVSGRFGSAMVLALCDRVAALRDREGASPLIGRLRRQERWSLAGVDYSGRGRGGGAAPGGRGIPSGLEARACFPAGRIERVSS